LRIKELLAINISFSKLITRSNRIQERLDRDILRTKGDKQDICSHGKFSTEMAAHFGRTSLQVQLHAGIATALQCKGDNNAG